MKWAALRVMSSLQCLAGHWRSTKVGNREKSGWAGSPVLQGMGSSKERQALKVPSLSPSYDQLRPVGVVNE